MLSRHDSVKMALEIVLIVGRWRSGELIQVELFLLCHGCNVRMDGMYKLLISHWYKVSFFEA